MLYPIFPIFVLYVHNIIDQKPVQYKISIFASVFLNYFLIVKNRSTLDF